MHETSVATAKLPDRFHFLLHPSDLKFAFAFCHPPSFIRYFPSILGLWRAQLLHPAARTIFAGGEN